MVVTGLNSLPYSASHARKDASLFLAKGGGGGAVERGGFDPSLPREDAGVNKREGGEGLIQNSRD